MEMLHNQVRDIWSRNPLAALYLSVGMSATLAVFMTWMVCYCKLLTGLDLNTKTPKHVSKTPKAFKDRRRFAKPKKYETTRRNSLSSIDEEDSALIDRSYMEPPPKAKPRERTREEDRI